MYIYMYIYKHCSFNPLINSKLDRSGKNMI